MTDLRAFNNTVKTAVARERENDANWSWNVKAVNKSVIKIGWGYLDYIGEKDCFTVKVTEDEAYTAVIGVMPNGGKHYAFIGPDHWDDAKTIEDGISQVIHSMALSAHNTY